MFITLIREKKSQLENFISLVLMTAIQNKFIQQVLSVT